MQRERESGSHLVRRRLPCVLQGEATRSGAIVRSNATQRRRRGSTARARGFRPCTCTPGFLIATIVASFRTSPPSERMTSLPSERTTSSPSERTTALLSERTTSLLAAGALAIGRKEKGPGWNREKRKIDPSLFPSALAAQLPWFNSPRTEDDEDRGQSSPEGVRSILEKKQKTLISLRIEEGGSTCIASLYGIRARGLEFKS